MAFNKPTPMKSQNPLPELRRRLTLVMVLFIGIIPPLATSLINLGQTITISPQIVIITGGCAISAYLLYQRIATAWIANIFAILIALALYLISGVTAFYIGLSIVLITAAIVSRLPIFLAVITLVFVRTILWQIDPSVTDSYPFLATAVANILLALVIRFVINQFERTANNLEVITGTFSASAEIGQQINDLLEIQPLLDATVESIRAALNFYHVQVFLIDQDYKYANLIASTGEAGKQLLARKHRLPVGSQSVIGRVSQVGEPVIAQNTKSDTVHAVNELLPDTRAELALPIIDGGNIIGALDVQSMYSDAFTEADIRALQIIANQLGIAIRNARLFQDAQRNINENKRLLFEYETNLREIERLNRRLTQEAWDNYLNQAVHITGVTLDSERFQPGAKWSHTMQQAALTREPSVEITEDKKLVAVPIILRGQVLGAIEVELAKNINESDTLELVKAISQRLAVSLESARLFEETQEASIQEQQINELVASYETATTVDELLQVTLQKLQQSLGADKGTIRLGANQAIEPSHSQNGGSSA